MMNDNAVYFIQKNGRCAIDCNFVWAQIFRHGLACVKRPSGEVSFVDRSGQTVVKLPRYQEEPTAYSDDRALVCNRRLFGFVDNIGREVIPPRFIVAYPFSEGVSAVKTKDGFAFIDPKGTPTAQRDNITGLDCLSDGLAAAKIDGLFYFIDRVMDIRLGPFESCGPFREGTACVMRRGRQVYINKSGGVIFENKWDFVAEIASEGTVQFSCDGKIGYADSSGREVIPPIYESGGFFSEGVAVVKRDGSCMGITRRGDVLFDTKFDWIGEFREGLARFQHKSKYGFIDTSGKVVIEAIFDQTSDFSEGLAFVKGPKPN